VGGLEVSVVTSQQRQRMGWLAVATTTATMAVVSHVLFPPVRPGMGRGVWLGVAAAGLILVCALFGLRKRWLRWRFGSVMAWRVAHHALGSLALVLSLVHCRLQVGGLLTTALLASLMAVVLSGIAGTVIQTIVPKMMTVQLHHEAAHDDFARLFVEYWRSVHGLVQRACGPQEREAASLKAAEKAAGIEAARAMLKPTEPPRAAPEALVAFYRSTLMDFFRVPSTAHPLATPAGAALAFATLRANVDARWHDVVSEIEQISAEARVRVEERRLHRVMLGWQIIHIPSSILLVVLTLVHGVAGIYY
jgi:hypothetical protein